jgi:hypothetical protein
MKPEIKLNWKGYLTTPKRVNESMFRLPKQANNPYLDKSSPILGKGKSPSQLTGRFCGFDQGVL